MLVIREGQVHGFIPVALIKLQRRTVIKSGFIPEHTVAAALMEHHLSAQLVYPHHVSKWVVLVTARVMAYLTARVLVIRSSVRQAACTACWFLQRRSRRGGPARLLAVN